MNKRFQQGFTLIEMLIVIGIIGILASLVLVGFGGARERAKDVRIISGLNQVRVIAEVRYAGDGNYDNVTTDDTEISNLVNDISANGGNLTIYKPQELSMSYCAYSILNAKSGPDDRYFCVDSTGNAVTLVTIGKVKCTLTNYTCE